jgi:hypothetical protein
VTEVSERRLAMEGNEELGERGGHSDMMSNQDDRSTADDVASEAFLANPSSSLDVKRREDIIEKENVGMGVDGYCKRSR